MTSPATAATANTATTHPDAAALFRAGQFAAAAEAGRAEHTASSLAIAARAALTRAAFLTTDRAMAKALVLQGENDADAALKLDPRNYDALFQRASGIGYRATLTNSPKLAGETQDDHAATDQEPIRRARRRGWGLARGTARRWTASASSWRAWCSARNSPRWTRALPKPKSAGRPIRCRYAYHGCLVLRIDPGQAARAKELLATAIRNRPREAYEVSAQKGAADVLALLQRGDVKGARVMAKKLGSFGRLG